MPAAARESLTGAVRDIDDDLAVLQRDGIVGRPGALARSTVERLHDDMMTAFWEAIRRPGGVVGRGPRRWYVELRPQDLSDFVALATHPWITAMSERVLGPDWQIVEVGFDTPFQGAKDQPWHRDFPAPHESTQDRRMTSLAFNITGVDVTQDMGPFEIAPGTHWDDGGDWHHGMFPHRDLWGRFAARAVRKFPRMGDISCRSALTVHRGTTHPSPIARPVLVLGVDAPGAGHAALHDLMVTRAFHEAMPPELRAHLACRVVEELVPVTQKHDIEGLVMG